jgi:hypothetical protein
MRNERDEDLTADHAQLRRHLQTLCSELEMFAAPEAGDLMA